MQLHLGGQWELGFRVTQLLRPLMQEVKEQGGHAQSLEVRECEPHNRLSTGK